MSGADTQQETVTNEIPLMTVSQPTDPSPEDLTVHSLLRAKEIAATPPRIKTVEEHMRELAAELAVALRNPSQEGTELNAL